MLEFNLARHCDHSMEVYKKHEHLYQGAVPKCRSFEILLGNAGFENDATFQTQDYDPNKLNKIRLEIVCPQVSYLNIRNSTSSLLRLLASSS